MLKGGWISFPVIVGIWIDESILADQVTYHNIIIHSRHY